jgi:hypothetical protein
MALLFMDGFDHYASADVNKKWNTGGTITAARGRRGTAALTTGVSSLITKTIPNTETIIVGFAFKIGTLGLNGNYLVIGFRDGASLQCELRWNNITRLLSITRNGTAISGAVGTTVIPTGVFNYIEIKAKISDSLSENEFIVRLNGTNEIVVPAGSDTKVTSNAYANVVTIGSDSSTTGAGYDIDDFYICNTLGSINNDFLGDCRIDTIMPNADGTYSDGTPSTGSDNYATVDEIPISTADFNTLANNGDRDSYQHGGLPLVTGSLVYGVQVNAAVDKDDSGARSAATFIRSGTVDEDGASVGLSTTYGILRDVYELNPDGNVAWDKTSVDNAEFGVVVTA